MIRVRTAYVLACYAIGLAMNMILVKFGWLTGWWLVFPDVGLGVIMWAAAGKAIW